MSIVEKLKKTLTTTDFTPEIGEEGSNIAECKNKSDYMSKDISSKNIPQILTHPKRENKFPELANEAIDKINNTPYWNEYSDASQEKMLSRYFDTKIKRPQYKGIKYSLTDKLSFIEYVLNNIK